MARKYWLFKVEPEAYSIERLEKDGTTCWEGVRNYQARNFLRDDVKVGDLVLVYRSNAEPSGVAGTAEVCRAGYPDPFAFDQRSPYFDDKSRRESPTWFAVDIRFRSRCRRVISLAELRGQNQLAGMLVLRKGQRLSVMPVTQQEFEAVEKLAGATCAS
ncbi:MAG: EVE domain-containing protein [Planctomycetes bacterium]|nr:EVE domain-containing protein [Planctomycetota bacterium]